MLPQAGDLTLQESERLPRYTDKAQGSTFHARHSLLKCFLRNGDETEMIY